MSRRQCSTSNHLFSRHSSIYILVKALSSPLALCGGPYVWLLTIEMPEKIPTMEQGGDESQLWDGFESTV